MKFTENDVHEINCLKNGERKMVVMSADEKYNFLIDNGIASEEALNLVTMINGFNSNTLEDALYCLTGASSFEDLAADLEG